MKDVTSIVQNRLRWVTYCARTRIWKRTALVKRVLPTSRNGLLALCDQGLVSITNFATAVIIGRVCGKLELGLYTLGWTLLSLATEISGILTTTPYTVFSPQLNRKRRRLYLGSILVYQVLLSLGISIAVSGGAVLASEWAWLPNNITGVVRSTAAVIVVVGLREFVRRVSFAALKVGWAVSVDATSCLGQIVGTVLLLHSGSLTASRAIIVLGLSSVIPSAGWLMLQRRRFVIQTVAVGQDVRRTWHFAKWVLASGVVSVFARYLYPWLLAALEGPSVTGMWAACTAIVAVGNPVVLGFGNYILPKLSNVYAACGVSAMERQVHRCGLQFAALLLPIVLVLSVCGERIVTGVYGNAYAGTSVLLLLLALNMLIGSSTNPYSQGLFSLGHAKADTLVNVLWVTLLFTIGILMVKSYGIVGAAVSMVLSAGITAVARITTFLRKVKHTRRSEPVGVSQSSGLAQRLDYNPVARELVE